MLRRSISRDQSDERIIICDNRSFFVKVDINNFTEPAVQVSPDGSLTLVTGEPLLADARNKEESGRTKDTEYIHDALTRGDQSIPIKANGIFSAVHYQPAKGTVCLITDRLGLRPLYFFLDEDYLIFASALRILEEIPEIPKRMDLRAVTQIVGLGYALGESTPYADIRMLHGAEIVTVRENNTERQKYSHWDRIEISSATEDEILSQLFGRFIQAVARRIRDDKVTAAFLSGGLDSRCIVAALREQNVDVHTFNFARPNTQDQLFGLEFAHATGAIHQEVPKKAGDLVPDYSSLLASVWSATNASISSPAERPGLVWSGEGGSVALGHVHLTEEIVRLMREDRIDDVIKEHLNRESAQVSPRIFKKKVSETLVRSVNEGIREEVSHFDCHDPARKFYLYLLLNDQHRKLANHFENIDLHRLEFQLPFFDSSFLELIVSIPIDLCLRHRLYVKWLSLFQKAVLSVPWQVYPGHQPCPVPIPTNLGYQWADIYQTAERASRKRLVDKQSTELLQSAQFPDEILNRGNLRFASWIHRTGYRDYQYLISPAHTYHHYWQKCSGKYVL